MKRCHPGGEALTRRLVTLAGWGTGAAVLDIGCGEGETAALLQRLCSAACRGIDIEPLPDAKSYIIRGDACALPFSGASFDGVLFECSLSPIRDQDAALREAYRVLKKGGRLALANMTARTETNIEVCGLGRLEPWQAQCARLSAAGFTLLCEEDRTDELLSLFGNMILNGEQTPDTALLKRARPGYRISVWQK